MPGLEPTTLFPRRVSQDPFGLHDEDAIDLETIIRFFRRSWRIFLVWAFVGLGVGTVYALISPAYYTAYARLLVEPGITPTAGLAGGASDAHTIYVDGQMQVLQSDDVLQRVVDRYRLTKDPEFGVAARGVVSLIRHSIHVLLNAGPAAVVHDPRYATIARVRRALSITRVRMSDVVELAFTSRNRTRSAEIANAIIESYIDGRREAAEQARVNTAAYLQKRLSELRDKAFPANPRQSPPSLSSESGEQARARFHEFENSTKAYRELYDRILQQAVAQAGAPTDSVGTQIITTAQPPLGRSSPRLVLVIAFVAAAGVAGIGHGLLRAVTDRSLRDVEDVQRSSGFDRIAGVPEITANAWIADAPLPRGFQPVYARVSPALADTVGKLAVRMARSPERRSGTIIGVVSMNEGTGASTVAAHLARNMAECGQQTLLADANWRQPAISQVFAEGCKARALDGALATIDQETERLNVLMLRAPGPISELNGSLSIADTLQSLRDQYECVVVDFHATERTVDFEASLPLIDHAVVVAEAGRTTSQALQGLLRVIPEDKIAGVVLNRVRDTDSFTMMLQRAAALARSAASACGKGLAFILIRRRKRTMARRHKTT